MLGGDVPISSIQATIAKLSIRPLPGSPEAAPNGRGFELASSVPPFDTPLPPALSSATPLIFPELSGPESAPAFSPPATPAPASLETEAMPTVETSGWTEEETSEEKIPEVLPSLPRMEPLASAPVPPTSSSSLELLASLTPEAFTLDNSLKGRHKMSKQSFLQPQNGEGLRGALPSDDPLSRLDPLWTLNKT